MLGTRDNRSLIRIVSVGKLIFDLTFAVTALNDGLGELAQVRNNDAPPNPALEPIQAMIGGLPHLHGSIQNTDPTFNAIPKALSLFKRGRAFIHFAFFTRRAALRNRNRRDA